ncbi:MAG TPA: transposase [Burkholderiaceae bacterium]|jgi:transposase|nr:transposase [Burkholderiaceae bacterium]
MGPITASAAAATVGNAKNLDSGRQMAAWLGPVPRHNSSRVKQTCAASRLRSTSI